MCNSSNQKKQSFILSHCIPYFNFSTMKLNLNQERFWKMAHCIREECENVGDLKNFTVAIAIGFVIVYDA